MFCNWHCTVVPQIRLKIVLFMRYNFISNTSLARGATNKNSGHLMKLSKPSTTQIYFARKGFVSHALYKFSKEIYVQNAASTFTTAEVLKGMSWFRNPTQSRWKWYHVLVKNMEPKCVFPTVRNIKKSIFILLLIVDGRHYRTCDNRKAYIITYSINVWSQKCRDRLISKYLDGIEIAQANWDPNLVTPK